MVVTALCLLVGATVAGVASARHKIGNGCSFDDVAQFSFDLAEFMDILTISQNAEIVSDDLEAFAESNMVEDLTYYIGTEAGITFISYSSRDEFLANYVTQTNYGGKIWLWAGPGYATCDKSGSTRTATYVAHGGDFIRGMDTVYEANTMYLARFKFGFIKEGSGDWLMNDISAVLVSDFGAFK